MRDGQTSHSLWLEQNEWMNRFIDYSDPIDDQPSS